MNPLVTIILINWNGWQDTIECLESLFQISYPNIKIIVVDNNSTNDSVDKLYEYAEGLTEIYSEVNPKIINSRKTKKVSILEINEDNLDIYKSSNEDLILLKNNDNYGFAKGNNVGIKFALNQLETDYILLLNNDTVVESDFLEHLVLLAENNEKIGFVGPKTYFYKDFPKKIIQIAGGGTIDLKIARTYQIGYGEKEENQFPEPFQLGYVSGSCILVKKEILQEIGLIDEHFFMYWEDTDWSYQGNLKGYLSYYQPKSIIWHKHGASSNPCFELYYLSRNRIYFIRKNTNIKEYIIFLLNFFLRVFFQNIWYYLIHLKDLSMLKAYLKGLLNGFTLKIE